MPAIRPSGSDGSPTAGDPGLPVPEPPPADWMDRFMEHVLGRDYDKAREVLRSAVARGVDKHVAEEYGKVLEEFLRKRDEAEEDGGRVLADFGVCVLREGNNETGRNLATRSFVDWGDELWRQRPLVYIQSPNNRRCVRACCACLVPVGSLATQLQHLGREAPPGAEAVALLPGAPPPVPCAGASGGCTEVFCSEACRDWALTAAPHAVLCTGRLQPTQLEALQAIEQLAFEAQHEDLLLLAHHVAMMVVRRREGEDLEKILDRYVRQFVSCPWDSEALAALSSETPARRQDLLGQALTRIGRIFDGDPLAKPFIDAQLCSGMLGTYELVNMCISLPHPLNSLPDQLEELLDSSTLAFIAAVQRYGEEEDSDEEGGTEEEEEEDEEEEQPHDAGATPSVPGEAAARGVEDPLVAARNGTLFASIVGTSLCEALAFMNHSCLPNARIDFATPWSVSPPAGEGPGLWVLANARRPLIPGDEVLMAYVPSVVGKPLAVRQKRMRKFGFECKCRCCVTDALLQADGEPI